MISDRSARLINAKDYGIKVGSQAEVTVIDAKSPAEAVATNAPVSRCSSAAGRPSAARALS
jgi:cytosine deaminase